MDIGPSSNPGMNLGNVCSLSPVQTRRDAVVQRQYHKVQAKLQLCALQLELDPHLDVPPRLANLLVTKYETTSPSYNHVWLDE